MKDYINIKNINEAIQGKTFDQQSTEDRLFTFTVNFYHAMSLLKANCDRKTTKEYITFLLTKSIVDVILALDRQVSQGVIDDLDTCVEQYLKIIDLNNDDIRNNFINIFNCETDDAGALPKLAALYCVATHTYKITNDDVTECLKTI